MKTTSHTDEERQVELEQWGKRDYNARLFVLTELGRLYARAQERLALASNREEADLFSNRLDGIRAARRTLQALQGTVLFPEAEFKSDHEGVLKSDLAMRELLIEELRAMFDKRNANFVRQVDIYEDEIDRLKAELAQALKPEFIAKESK